MPLFSNSYYRLMVVLSATKLLFFVLQCYYYGINTNFIPVSHCYHSSNCGSRIIVLWNNIIFTISLGKMTLGIILIVLVSQQLATIRIIFPVLVMESLPLELSYNF